MSIYHIHGNLVINGVVIDANIGNFNIHANLSAPNISISTHNGFIAGNLAPSAILPTFQTGFFSQVQTYVQNAANVSGNTSITMPSNIISARVFATANTNVASQYVAINLNPTLVGTRNFFTSVTGGNTLNIQSNVATPYNYKVFVEYQ